MKEETENVLSSNQREKHNSLSAQQTHWSADSAGHIVFFISALLKLGNNEL